jgi:hypothetical protein
VGFAGNTTIEFITGAATCMVAGPDELAALLASPSYIATTVWLPAVRDGTVTDAWFVP